MRFRVLITLLLIVLSGFYFTSAQSDLSSDEEANVDVVLQLMYLLFEEADVTPDMLDGYFADTVVHHGFMDLPDPLATMELDEPAQYYADWRNALKQAFPDGGALMSDVTIQDTAIVVYFDWLGTYSGTADYEGMTLDSPDEAQYAFDAVAIYHFNDAHEVVEVRFFIDGIDWLNVAYFGGELSIPAD